MKKITALIALSIALVVLGASPALAVSLKVSASTKTVASGKVQFVAKTSRPSKVKVTVYRGSTAMRTLSATRSGGKYVATWNRADWRGRALAAGTYAYKVTATVSSTKRSVRGKVTIAVATPSPATAPQPIPVSRWIGFYADGNSDTVAPLDAIESEIATHSAVENFFVGDDEQFPSARVSWITAHGSVPMITLEFHSLAGVYLDGINNGSHDAYIAAFADAAKAAGVTIWLRPMHEMNGNWDPWCGTVGNNTPAKFVTAWRRIHDIFVAHGATNVKFVWAINDNSVPDTTTNAIENYWPGDAYVDYAGVDLYNWGTSQSWSHWTAFSSAFADPYARISKLTNKPIFLAEAGCAELGGNKAAWVTDMFSKLNTTYTRVIGVCWFNVNKETDWRIDSSASSLAAFKTVMANGY